MSNSRIRIEFLAPKKRETIEMCYVGRIPIEGELIEVEDSVYTVKMVCHMIDAKGRDPEALVRVA